jgi:hypothetical protein
MLSLDHDLDRPMQVLMLATIALYLAPAALGQRGARLAPWMRRAAVATLALGMVIALIASVRWFLR